MSFAQKQYDAETQEVARVARSIQHAQSDLSWGQCIELAEKYVGEED